MLPNLESFYLTIFFARKSSLDITQVSALRVFAILKYTRNVLNMRTLNFSKCNTSAIMNALEFPDDTRVCDFCEGAKGPLRFALSVLSARRLHLRMTSHGSACISCYQERSVRVSVYKAKTLKRYISADKLYDPNHAQFARPTTIRTSQTRGRALESSC